MQTFFLVFLKYFFGDKRLQLSQVEDKYTYNFHWYTSYACPERPHACMVTDPSTLDQYDLSR